MPRIISISSLFLIQAIPHFLTSVEKIDVRLEIRRTEEGYMLVGADLGRSMEPEKKIALRSTNVLSDSEHITNKFLAYK